MIVGVTGSMCSGKTELANYLEKSQNFEAVNLQLIFKQHLQKQGISTDKYCFEYYQKEFKGLRMSVISQVFKDLTQKWHKNYVIYPLSSFDDIQLLISKFYFIQYCVEAPVKIRHKRFQQKYETNSLTEFIDMDDKMRFDSENSSLYAVNPEHQRHIRRGFHNTDEDLEKFHLQLEKFNFNNKELVRPQFDTYFMRLAELAASRSNCMKRAIGCCIVNNQRVLSTGYNGTPFGCKNCNEGGCMRCNANVTQGVDLDQCLCLHAEESAIMEVGRDACIGATLYTTVFPCQFCTKKVIQSGIVRVVFQQYYNSDLSWQMFSQLTNIEITEINSVTGQQKIMQSAQGEIASPLGKRQSSISQLENIESKLCVSTPIKRAKN